MAQYASSHLSDDPVVHAWATPSSHGSTVYETILRQSGLMTCDCPGWVFKRGGERDCKHVRMYTQEATRILDDIRAGRRPQQTPRPRPAAPPRPEISTAPTSRRRAIIFDD